MYRERERQTDRGQQTHKEIIAEVISSEPQEDQEQEKKHRATQLFSETRQCVGGLIDLIISVDHEVLEPYYPHLTEGSHKAAKGDLCAKANKEF